MDAAALLVELEPTAAQLLDRHLAQAKEWFPHELVPYSQGRDFGPGYEWSPDETPLAAEVRSSLFVNLLTEDNLPYYFRTIEAMFGRDSAWGEWSRRWTAEEGRHSIVIRDYLTVTRAIDPVALERARMAQVSCGQVPEPTTPQDGLVYVTLQELATRIAHHNTGKMVGDPVGYEVMKRVASDENRHHLFYRDLSTAALAVDPSGMVLAIERQVREFEMPGTGIVDFETHARAIARAGIYDFGIHHAQILVPVVLRHWGIEELTGLSDPAERARDSLITRIDRIGKAGRRLARRRAESDQRPTAAGERVPEPV
jgi:acyl-[acyl-carrier protein] desaturase